MKIRSWENIYKGVTVVRFRHGKQTSFAAKSPIETSMIFPANDSPPWLVRGCSPARWTTREWIWLSKRCLLLFWANVDSMKVKAPTNFIWLWHSQFANWKDPPFLSSVNHLFRLGPWLKHGELLVITRGVIISKCWHLGKVSGVPTSRFLDHFPGSKVRSKAVICLKKPNHKSVFCWIWS